MTEHIEWEITVDDDGWWVHRRRQIGNLRWVRVTTYGPMARNELLDVIDADVWSLVFPRD